MAEAQWALTGLGLALLVLLVLPGAQIKLGAAQLNGLIGSYTSGGGWVPCDANGNPLSYNDPGLNSDGSAALLHTGSQPTADNTYPVPKTGAASWWYGCYSPQAPGGGSYPSGGGYPGSGGGLSTASSAGNTTSPPNGGTIGFYDPNNYGGDRSDSGPLPPDLNGTVTTNGSDTLKARFLWTGAGPAPTQATFIIQTSVSATASVGYGSSGKTSGLSATATVSLGNDTVTATDGGSSGSKSGGSWQAQQVSPSGGIATVSLSGSVSTTTKNTLAYATWVPGDHDFYYAGPGAGQTGANAGATASGSVYPMSIILTGPVSDAQGKHILVGQGCSASLSTIPHLFTNANPPVLNWTVSGNTFQSWNGESGTTPVQAVMGFGPANQGTPHWYWSDKAGKQTVTCTAKVTPPAGQGAPFSYTDTQTVDLQVPTVVATNFTGVGYVGPYQNATAPGVYAGPSSGMKNNGQEDGSTWVTSIALPPSPVYSGVGKWGYAQLITPGEYITGDDGTTTVQSTDTGVEALDSAFPYASTHAPDGTRYNDGDSPALDNLSKPIALAKLTDTFKTYLMFQPPGADVQWVPLKESVWDTNFNATRPSGGDWTTFPANTSVGPVEFGSKGYDFKDQTTHPSWVKVLAKGTPFIH